MLQRTLPRTTVISGGCLSIKVHNGIEYPCKGDMLWDKLEGEYICISCGYRPVPQPIPTNLYKQPKSRR